MSNVEQIRAEVSKAWEALCESKDWQVLDIDGIKAALDSTRDGFIVRAWSYAQPGDRAKCIAAMEDPTSRGHQCSKQLRRFFTTGRQPIEFTVDEGPDFTRPRFTEDQP